MNKIDQIKITPQILEKIKEVNNEAGHRTYLEVPEIVRIICEVVEANYNVIPMNMEEIEFNDNLYCFVLGRKSNAAKGKCSECGISVWDTQIFSENHSAMI
jgi:hypothetical protein